MYSNIHKYIYIYIYIFIYIQNVATIQQIWLYGIIGGTLPMCQNTTIRVNGAWIKIYCVYVQKHITPCTVVITSLLGRDKPLVAPASVKRVFCGIITQIAYRSTHCVIVRLQLLNKVVKHPGSAFFIYHAFLMSIPIKTAYSALSIRKKFWEAFLDFCDFLHSSNGMNKTDHISPAFLLVVFSNTGSI